MWFFTWLRQQVKAAVLAGVNDAAAELGEVLDPAEPARLLRQRLEALPAPAPAAASENGHGEPAASGKGRRGKGD